MPPPKTIIVLGCTASGKSDLAEALALLLPGTAPTAPASIMAVDSMQVYRGMDIGTAKPDAATRTRIPYQMLDVADPWEAYSAARFVAEAKPMLETQNTKPETRNKYLETQSSPLTPTPYPLILVAGTILYLRSLIEGLFEGPSADEALRAELHERARVEGTMKLHSELALLDPLAASRIHPNDLRRIVRALEVFRLTGTPISTLQTQWTQEKEAGGGLAQVVDPIYIGIRREKEHLNRRINARVKKMIDAGLVEEVRRLKDDPRGFSEEAASAVGYKQLLDHFSGKCTLDEAIEQIKIQTRYLAKMQRTWLKRWPPPAQVHWLDAAEGIEGADIAGQALSLIESSQHC